MPDLAASGGQAVSAAETQGPITIKPPTFNCEEHRGIIVDLLKAILKREARVRIDVEVVVNLCTGMTALLADPKDAIAQVVQRIGLLSETTGWAQPGWSETVSQFGRHHTSAIISTPVDTPSPLTGAGEDGEATEGTVSLQISPRRREAGLPSLYLSEELRARLTWLAVETCRPLEETVTLLVQHYLYWRQEPETMATLRRTLALSQQLNVRRIDPSILEEYLRARAALNQYGRTLEDVPEALRLIARLAQLSEPWDWARAEQAIHSVGLLIGARIYPEHIEALLLAHERLKELGFDERAAVAVAEALVRAGANGPRRSRVLAVMVTLAGMHVDLHDAEEEYQRVQDEVALSEAKCCQLRKAEEDLTTSVAGLQGMQRDLHEHIAHMETEAATRQSRFDVLAAFESFLQGNVQVIDASGELFDRVRELAHQGAQPGRDSVALAADLHAKILEVLAHHYANAGRAA